MKINGPSPEIVRSEPTREIQRVSNTQDHANSGQPSAAARRGDDVQISDAGRALASQASSRGEMSAERIADVREKILSGAYNSLEVVDQVARKMLISGDI
jgi:negative regulator of flagellin synthesis FlgM